MGNFTFSDGEALSAADTNNLYYRTIDQSIDLGGDGSDGALSISSGTTNISGIKQYTNVDVTGTAVLNIQGPTIIMCTGYFNLENDITSDSNTTGGCCAEGGGSGGGGGGGMSGTVGQQILRYHYLRMPLGGGIGGDSGTNVAFRNTGDTGGSISCGGGGGGAAGYLAGGNGGAGTQMTGVVSSAIQNSGGTCKFGLCIEAIGNVTFGATSTVVLSGGNGSSGASGGGGGGGGASLQVITLGNLTYTTGAAITSTGGNGGSGAASYTPGGGGGGSGGFIKFWYLGSLTDNGTTTVTAGTGGSSNVNEAGSNGSAGLYETEQLEDF